MDRKCYVKDCSNEVTMYRAGMDLCSEHFKNPTKEVADIIHFVEFMRS